MKKLSSKKNNQVQTLQLVCFKMDCEDFGIDILKVKEITKMSVITPLNEASDFIDGLINLRGKSIPVINLRSRLQLPRKEYDSNARIIVTEKNDKTIGLIVDSVSIILRLDLEHTGVVSEIINPNLSNYTQSIVKFDDRIVIIIDIDEIINKSIMETIIEVAA